MNSNNCIACKHWYFDSGSPGYSEYTPGSAVSTGCLKNYWVFKPYDDTEEDFRKKMQKANTCKDYEHYQQT